MAIVINGSGTISGISVGGLPDSIVDAGTLATNSVDSAELIDGAVDASHLASGAATDATKLPLAGGTLTGDLNFGDNVDANFGAGADLKIYHDGSNSYIDDAGGGILFLRGNDEVRIDKYTGENMITCATDGAVNLYYDNAKKIETTGYGIAVTGKLELDSSSTVLEIGEWHETGSTRGLRFFTSTNFTYQRWNSKITGASYYAEFYNPNGFVGAIYSSGSSAVYATSSDHRLKENVDYTWDATTRLKQLKPARFNWISDDTNTLVDGFLAHEVSSVVPEAVVGTKDAMTAEVLYVEGDELPEGKVVGDVKEASAPNYQAIDQSKLVPLLVKTIQELEARITALEA